ncbi:hypothetical protein [Nocardia sp. A7]|uniref:hypothetical protein n=1 Tax=Nocardia sp. A7 TaxID=2789274 RepID=UPI0039788ABB
MSAPSVPESTSEERARELVIRIARALGEMGPPGWQELSAVFTMTVALGGGQVNYVDAEEQVLQASVPEDVLALAAEQRVVSADAGDGPWWRLLMRLDTEGELEVDYDYGDDPFPDDQLFAPEAYLADLAEYPRRELPMWLSAYLFHDDRQTRSPAVAAERARADRESGTAAVATHDELPELPAIWVRWTVLSAAFVAVRSEWGPRIMPSFGWFEGAQRSGATLYLLPRARAVLSGGVWEADALRAAYRNGSELPPVYAGAPAWVTDQVLNARAATGMVSFCYWWLEDRWYRGAGSETDRIDEAMPGIWSDDAAELVVRGLIGAGPGSLAADHVADLLVAAYEGALTRGHVLAVFGADADIDSAMHQLTMSGAAIVEP